MNSKVLDNAGVAKSERINDRLFSKVYILHTTYYIL